MQASLGVKFDFKNDALFSKESFLIVGILRKSGV